MKEVTEKEFLLYLKNKKYKVERGNTVHTDNFIIDDKIVACRITSSWNSETIYKLLL